jgi:hypothetical protein
MAGFGRAENLANPCGTTTSADRTSLRNTHTLEKTLFPMWVEIALLWLLIHFEDTGSAWAAYFLALLSGLLIYEYTAYHLVVLVVIGYLLAHLVLFTVQWLRAADPELDPRRQLAEGFHTYAPGVFAMVLVWIIVAHFQLMDDIRRGMGSWFSGGVGGHAQDPDGLLARLLSPRELPAFLVRKLLIPVRAAYLPGQADSCRYLGIGGDPAFDRATAIAMGAGFLLVAATFRRRFHALVLMWAGVVICGAALFPSNANRQSASLLHGLASLLPDHRARSRGPLAPAEPAMGALRAAGSLRDQRRVRGGGQRPPRILAVDSKQEAARRLDLAAH